MGFSTPIASSIILIAFTILVSMLSHTLVMEAHTLSQVMNKNIVEEASRLGVILELNITAINATDDTINFVLRNKGSHTIFLKNQGYIRNDVIVAYNISNTKWISQIASYEVLKIRVPNTGMVFYPTSHLYLAPGEEALIQVKVNGLEPGSIVNVVFVSHYGVTAQAEGVASQ